MTTNNLQISYADLERAGWPNNLIEDYQSFKRETQPQRGVQTDPNGIYKGNINGFYVDTATPALWFNPNIGSLDGWLQM